MITLVRVLRRAWHRLAPAVDPTDALLIAGLVLSLAGLALAVWE